MATVPTVDTFSAAPAALPSARQDSIASPSLFGASADNQLAFGNALTGVGNAVNRVARQMESQANQVRADDAINQVYQARLDLTYDPEQGYAAKKGAAALEADPDGMPLPDSYSAKLKAKIDDIGGKLSNDEQRRIFGMQANNVLTQFNGSVQAHMLQEYNHYAVTTQEGTIKIGADTALANWQDMSDSGPRQEAINSVKAAVAKRGQLTGEGASETVARMKVAESGIHLGIVDSALRNSDPGYAMSYLAKNKQHMTAEDVLKVQGALERQTDASFALTATADATREHARKFAPTEVDRLQGLLGMEVAPGEDKSIIGPALDAFVSKYGNAAKAVAAFDATPEKVDEAIKKAEGAKAPEAWLTFLPKSTQEYVAAKMNALAAGQGAPKPPTELEFVNSALAKLPADTRPELVKLTRDQASRQYKLITEDRKQRGEQAETEVQQALVANGGDFAALDPQLKSNLARLDPQAYGRTQAYARTVGNDDPATDWGRYYELRREATGSPAVFAKRNLLAEYPHLGKAQRESLIDLQQKASDPTAIGEAATLAQQLSNVHDALGWDKSDVEKKGKFDTVVAKTIDTAQKAKGAKLDFEERQKIIDRMVIQGSVKGSGFVFSDSGHYYEFVGREDAGNFVPEVPKEERAKIEAALTRKGLPISDAMVMKLYKQNYGLR